MKTINNFAFGILVSLVTAAVAFAQAETANEPPPPTAVVVSGTAAGVRFAALGSVRQMRVEVFGASGDSVSNSGFKAGNVYDWRMEDGRGLPLPDGAYVFVVTFRDASGRVGMKQGGVVLRGGRPSFQLADAEQPAGQERSNGAAGDDAAGALTLTAHDGRDGQLVSTRGGLSFRAGDFFSGKERELMRLTPDGDLGVGVSEPKARLDVAGAIRARGGIQFGDGTVLTSARRAPAGGTSTSGTSAEEVTAAAVTGMGTTNKLTKWLDTAGTLGDSVISESGGNVGIGTSTPNPNGVLHVHKAQATGTSLFVTNDSTSGSALSSLRAGLNPNDYAVDYASINVLGANWPAGAGGSFLKGKSGLLESSGSNFGIGNINNTEPIIFYTTAQRLERMRLTAAGNLGIGTTNPQSKLEVSGDLKVSGSAVVDGNIAAKYQDVAEWVRARGPLAAGTIVTLDGRDANTVRASTRAYDTRVAGVVSERPGVILGEGGTGKVMVATTGRVKVKVDATRHPVRVGDLLVTSAEPGTAMKSLPVRLGSARMHRPGTIVGKALEPLPGGRGEILVLLTLQ